MRISNRNLYAVLCYAWDVLDRRTDVPTGVDDAAVPAELLAQVLAREADRLLKRGLVRSYVAESDELRRPRGRIDMSETISRALLAQRRLHCTYEELTHANVPNRLLRASIAHAAHIEGLQPETRRHVRLALRRFPEVPALPLTPGAFAAVRFDRQTAPYRMALHAAQLLTTSTVPVAGGTGLRFDDFTRDEHRMGRLFQIFVSRFLRAEQGAWVVTSPTLDFLAEGDHDVMGKIPRMETDITLRGRAAARGDWILELKCVGETTQRRNGKDRFRSDHLYQLLTYLETRARTGAPARGGVLLYAESHAGPMRDNLVLNGHVVKIRTVPLHQEWSAATTAILGLCDELSSLPCA